MGKPFMLAGVALASGALLAAAAAAQMRDARVVFQDAGMMVLVERGACGREINLVVRAPSRSVFSGERIQLRRLVGAAVQLLGFECPVVEKFTIRGEAFDELHFAGAAWPQGSWSSVRFVGLDAPP